MDDQPFAAELKKLKSGNPTGDQKRWEMACHDAENFLVDWGAEALRVGWTGDELFGLHPVAPLARYDAMGLVWFLRDRAVEELTVTFARIGNTRFLRRRV